MLEITGLEKTYPTPEGPLPVLRGVSLSVAAGERVAVTGESGSGKSTLLHLAAGLDRADGGEIRVGGQALSGLSDAGRAGLRRARIGLVFQQYNLVPSLTVAGNLALQARLAGRHDPALVARLAGRLGIEALMTRYPEQISGGQQQRVAIGRALAARPALLLADEPTGNLDEASAAAVIALMGELAAETGAALLIVTHSEAVATAGDRRVHLARGRIA